MRLLVISDVPSLTDEVRVQVDRILNQYRLKGWNVVLDDQNAEVEVRKNLPTGPLEIDKPNRRLYSALAHREYDATLVLRSKTGEGIVHAVFQVPVSADED